MFECHSNNTFDSHRNAPTQTLYHRILIDFPTSSFEIQTQKSSKFALDVFLRDQMCMQPTHAHAHLSHTLKWNLIVKTKQAKPPILLGEGTGTIP